MNRTARGESATSPEAIRAFVEFLAAKFEGKSSTFGAFHLDGFTVVAARDHVGDCLESFVENDLGGEVQRAVS